jgi:hypothetical protein
MLTTMARDLQNLRREQRQLENLLDASVARQVAEKEWRQAIVEAYRAGISSRRIGEAVGLTHTRVLQILREEQ